MDVKEWIKRDVDSNTNFVESHTFISRIIMSKNGRVMIYIIGDDEIDISVDHKALDRIFTEVKDFGYNSDFKVSWISDRVVNYLNNVSSMEE